MKTTLLILALIITVPLQTRAQYEEYLQEDPEPTSQAFAGGAFSMLENGSGFGGFYEWPLPGFISIGGVLNFYMLRDNKQVDFINPYTGYPETYGKVNNVYWFDLGLRLKKRLFARDIDDQFRPFVAATVGPVFGMNFPEVKSLDDQYSWALSGGLAAGVDVVLDTGYVIGFQLQYRLMHFTQNLGEIDKGNFSTLDLSLELGKSF